MIGDLAHICNRGFEKSAIFRDQSDYMRFVETLYKINNIEGSLRFKGKNIFQDLPQQNKIVDILIWCLMPNHFHLLLHEAFDGGIVEFTKRLGNSYTKYFNIRYKRSGYLFQNAAKIVSIENQSQMNYIPLYIDLNPLDLAKDKTISENEERSLHFLENYQWASFGDYHGKNHFPEIINHDLFYELFDTNQKQYKKEIKEWITPDRRESLQFNYYTTPPAVNLAGWRLGVAHTWCR